MSMLGVHPPTTNDLEPYKKLHEQAGPKGTNEGQPAWLQWCGDTEFSLLSDFQICQITTEIQKIWENKCGVVGLCWWFYMSGELGRKTCRLLPLLYLVTHQLKKQSAAKILRPDITMSGCYTINPKAAWKWVNAMSCCSLMWITTSSQGLTTTALNFEILWLLWKEYPNCCLVLYPLHPIIIPVCPQEYQQWR